jgi:hypothetical protein
LNYKTYLQIYYSGCTDGTYLLGWECTAGCDSNSLTEIGTIRIENYDDTGAADGKWNEYMVLRLSAGWVYGDEFTIAFQCNEGGSDTFVTDLATQVANGDVDEDGNLIEDDGSTYYSQVYTVTDTCPRDANNDPIVVSQFDVATCPDGFFCNPFDEFSSALSIQPCPLGYMFVSGSDQ